MTIIEENKTNLDPQPSSAPDEAANALPDEQTNPSSEPEEEPDVENFTREELLEILRRKVNSGFVRENIELVREIEDAYNELRKAREAEQRAAWTSEAPFHYIPDTLDEDFAELIRTFHQKVKEERRQFREQLEKNLQVKKQIVEQLKALAASEEFTPQHVRQFRELRQQWHQTGQVPRQEKEQLYQTYRFYVGQLHRMQDQYFQLMQTDKTANLKVKRDLLQHFRQLLSIRDPFQLRTEFRKAIEEWRHYGPVPKEYAEEIDAEFQNVREQIIHQLDRLWATLREEEAQTEARKQHVIERIEELTQPYQTRRDWEEAVRRVRALVTEFYQPGPLPPRKRRQLKNALKEALDQFYGLRRQFFAAKDEASEKIARQIREKYIHPITELIQLENMRGARKKMAELADRCEREIRRYDISPPVRNRLRKELKEVKEAFLKKWADYQAKQELIEEKNYARKKEFLRTLREEVEKGVDDPAAFLKKTMQQWQQLGFVPRNRKDEVEDELRQIIMPLIEQLGEGQDTETLRKRLQLEAMPKDQLVERRRKLNADIAHITAEKDKLERNLEMFGDMGGKLVENYRQRVAKLEDKLKALQAEQAIIKELLG